MKPAPRQGGRLRRLFLWLSMGTAATFLALATAAYGAMTLSREAKMLKAVLLTDDAMPHRTCVQVTVGPILLGVARLAGVFCADIPEEVRAALGGVHRVSVGVYELTGGRDSAAPEFRSADAAMADAGWSRLVGVKDAGTEVRVYTPFSATDDSLRVCVAVKDGVRLVIVATDVDAERLTPLLTKHLPRRETAL